MLWQNVLVLPNSSSSLFQSLEYCSVALSVDGGLRFKAVHTNTTTWVSKTVVMTLSTKVSPHVNLCDDIPCADVWFQVHNEAPVFHWLSQYCEEIAHLLSCNVAGKFQLFKLPYLSSACRNSSCTNRMIRMNINNVTLTFLWIAKLDSSFPFSSPSIVLNEFIKLFLVKATGCWHRPPTSLFITPISFFPVRHPYIFLAQQCTLLTSTQLSW